MLQVPVSSAGLGESAGSEFEACSLAPGELRQRNPPGGSQPLGGPVVEASGPVDNQADPRALIDGGGSIDYCLPVGRYSIRIANVERVTDD